MPDFLLPDLGEGLEEAEVTAWHVRVGDQVAVDQIVAEVETAKAVVELPTPFAGTVTALHAEPGTTIPVGSPLITVTAAPDAGRPGPRTGDAPDAGSRAPRAAERGDADEASGNVLVGYGHLGARPGRGGRHHLGARPGRGGRRGRLRLRAGSGRSPRADAGRPGAGHLADRAQARPPGRA